MLTTLADEEAHLRRANDHLRNALYLISVRQDRVERRDEPKKNVSTWERARRHAQSFVGSSVAVAQLLEIEVRQLCPTDDLARDAIGIRQVVVRHGRKLDEASRCIGFDGERRQRGQRAFRRSRIRCIEYIDRMLENEISVCPDFGLRIHALTDVVCGVSGQRQKQSGRKSGDQFLHGVVRVS